MNDMQEFLQQIGAASISPIVELPLTGTKPRLASLHQRIQDEIDSVNVSSGSFILLVTILLNNYILYLGSN